MTNFSVYMQTKSGSSSWPILAPVTQQLCFASQGSICSGSIILIPMVVQTAEWRLGLTTPDQCGQNPTSITAIKGCKSLVQSTHTYYEHRHYENIGHC